MLLRKKLISALLHISTPSGFLILSPDRSDPRTKDRHGDRAFDLATDPQVRARGRSFRNRAVPGRTSFSNGFSRRFLEMFYGIWEYGDRGINIIKIPDILLEELVWNYGMLVWIWKWKHWNWKLSVKRAKSWNFKCASSLEIWRNCAWRSGLLAMLRHAVSSKVQGTV